MKKALVVLIGSVLLLLLLTRSGVAATALQLKGMLDRGERITIVDIRNGAEYRDSHIPGAINIPESLLPTRDLPPIGKVIVCGDGFSDEVLRTAVSALNAKAGMQAEALEGGFPAWSALHHQDTRSGGMTSEKLRYLSYRELEKATAENPDVVLLDMRQRDEPKMGAAGARPKGGGAPAAATKRVAGRTPADLGEKFPGAKSRRLVRTPGPAGGAVEVPAAVLAQGERQSLYVLIDDGDGEAEKVAHRLRAAGITRLAILAGGELTVVRGGQAGLETKGGEK